MAIYAIGDIQGCYEPLLRLLDVIQFDKNNDQLWFAGDLVNRGPESLAVLRFVKSLDNAAITVLGNHDLHLLAAACAPASTNTKETLKQILKAPDRDELIAWLRHRPLFYYANNFCLVHAGIPPQWDFQQTCNMAKLAEQALQSSGYANVLQAMYGNKPNLWSNDLSGMPRLRFIINSFTRMRYCDHEGRLDFDHNGPPGSQPKHLMPWFKAPGRLSAGMRIVFGHWSALGYYEGDNCYAIDTGCLWGGQLTAIRLDEQVKRFSVDCGCHNKFPNHG